MPDLYLDFDGRQLRVRTDVPEVHDHIARVHAPMLVPEVTRLVGDLLVDAVPGGHRMRGASELTLQGRADDLFIHIKADIIYQMITSRPDLLWLHAGAVEKDGVAVVVSGPPGRGKSTLVTLLARAGWRLMSDDVLALDMCADVVVPFPQLPNPRVFPGREVTGDDFYALQRELAVMPAEAFHRERTRLGAVIFPCFQPGAEPDLVRRRPGEGALDMLRNCVNVADHKAAAVARAAGLARVVPMYSLTYGVAASAVDQIQRLLDSVLVHAASMCDGVGPAVASLPPKPTPSEST
ncbi:hypothetical protein tb265_15840 [Gemmatimonadetes bacterium T265]|nr:hypothetical protein tb265_15840 [Gemmatimonadetes bacterium T265]